MGRWSRGIARQFLTWLALPTGLDWLDVGCGTGALTSALLDGCAPSSVTGVDPSAAFVAHAKQIVSDGRVSFEVGAAQELPFERPAFDVAVSALAYNFFPDRPAALAEIRRTLRPGGKLALYVWDYPGGGVEFIREFWATATALDPGAAALDEAARFASCTPGQLQQEFETAGLADVDVRAIETPTTFADFEDLWQPFTLGAGPAPGYLTTLGASGTARFKEAFAARFPATGPVELAARAWAVRGTT